MDIFLFGAVLGGGPSGPCIVCPPRAVVEEDAHALKTRLMASCSAAVKHSDGGRATIPKAWQDRPVFGTAKMKQFWFNASGRSEHP